MRYIQDENGPRGCVKHEPQRTRRFDYTGLSSSWKQVQRSLAVKLLGSLSNRMSKVHKPRDALVTSRMMAAVRSKDSKAEMALRRELHRLGIRYRVHARDVFGCPDIVWRAKKVAVFVDGDMWHGRAWKTRGLSRLEDMFPTNTDWWANKIRGNQRRDRQVTKQLRHDGWRVVRLWESDVLASPPRAARRVLKAIAESSEACLKKPTSGSTRTHG